LDLTEVESVDNAGTYLLALLHNRGVQLIASGLVMTELVAAIEEQWQLGKEREELSESFDRGCALKHGYGAVRPRVRVSSSRVKR
jgi:hypothetical protein